MTKKLFVIGDSISMQYGPYLKKLCRGKFHYSRKKGNGGDSNMVRAFAEWQTANDKIKYDIVLLNCGLHDIKTRDGRCQVERPQYRENLRAVLAVFKERHVCVLWVRTTPVFDEIHNRRTTEISRCAADLECYNQAADEIMAENHIESIDLYGFTLPFLPDGYCDHVHFNQKVRKAQAAFIFKEVYRHAAK